MQKDDQVKQTTTRVFAKEVALSANQLSEQELVSVSGAGAPPSNTNVFTRFIPGTAGGQWDQMDA